MRRRLTFVALVIAGLLVVVGGTAEAGLIWHSALDGDASALVGGDGVATGTPTATADLNGIAGGAVLFGGDADVDFFTVTPTLASFTAGSISAWVRPDTVDGSEDGVIGVGASGGGSSVYFSFMNRDDERWRVDLDDGSDRRDVLSNAAAAAGAWRHMVVTFDSASGGSEELRMYIDAALQSDVQGIGGDNDPYTMSNDWLIGTERTGSRFFNGAIDDVRIYDHELSQNEITALFEQGPLYVPEPATVCLLGLGALG
ncbi:MAG: LamG domain-containing protein, partial [Planctomycetota bacterium]